MYMKKIKRIFLALILAICILFPMTTVMPVIADNGEINLISNDFSSWEKSGNVEIVAGAGYLPGSDAVCMKVSDGQAWQHEFWTSGAIAVTPNTNYRLEFYAKISDDLGAIVYAYDEVVYSENNRLYDAWDHARLSSSTDWTKYTVDFKTREKTELFIRVQNTLSVAGEFWFSDFNLFGIDNSNNVNLVKNPGFENDFSDWEIDALGSANNWSVTTDEKHGGEKALLVTNPVGGWNNNKLISADIPVSPNTDYTLTYWAKVPDGEQSKFWIEILDPDNVVDKGGWYGFDRLNGGEYCNVWVDTYNEWRQLAIPFRTGSSTKRIYFQLEQYNDGTGNFYFDDFEILGELTGLPDLPDIDQSLDYHPTRIVDESFDYDPTAWTLGDGFFVTDSQSYAGKYSLASTADASGFAQSMRIPVIGGKEYDLTFYIKGSGTAQILNDKKELIESMTASAPASAWEKQTLSFDNPLGNEGVYINISSGSEAGYFDEFRLLQSDAVNLYPNGDFENDSFLPAGSSDKTTRLIVVNEPENVYAGNGSLKIEGTAGIELNIYPLEPNTTYYASVYIKAPEGTYLGAKSYDDTSGLMPYVQSLEYERHEISFTTGANKDGVCLFVWNGNINKTTYIDNFEIYALPVLEKEIEDDFDETSSYKPLSDPGDSRNWKYSTTFSDEFENASLDMAKWKYPASNEWRGEAWNAVAGGPAGSYEFKDENVSVKNGQLVLDSKMITDNVLWHTANVTSTQKTSYGYYEIEARITPMASSCAFWFADGRTRTEIDVFELFGRGIYYNTPGEGDIPISTHFWPNGYGESDFEKGIVYKSGLDLAANYHVYGFEWGEHFLRFYLDGELIHERANEYFFYPQNIIFDIEVFPGWGGRPTQAQYDQQLFEADGTTARNPTEYQINYIRVWRSDIEQSDEPIMEEIKYPAKDAYAAYGSPDIAGDSIDEKWDAAMPIGELHPKSGDTATDGIVKTMWDEEYLYVMADIADDDVYTGEATYNYQTDSFEVYLDYFNTKSGTERTNCFTINVNAADKLEQGGYPGQVVHNVIAKEGGYIVLMAIPWVYGVGPEPGEDMILGFDVQINDANSITKDRAAYKGWNDYDDKVWEYMYYSGNLFLMRQPVHEHTYEWIEYENCKKYECQICGIVEDIICLNFNGAKTNAGNISGISENVKGVWIVTFAVEVPYEDGEIKTVNHTVEIGKNSDGEIDLGEYVLRYDIKGNGSNIKVFEIVKK